jgi:hypothetical protein
MTKRPKTLNRLQHLITDWEQESGLPVRRLNLRVASMMLAGALGRIVDEDEAPIFLARGGVAMELRAGDKARATRDVDLLLRGDAVSLVLHLDAAFSESYEEFSFERDEPQPLKLRPHVRRVHVKVAFRSKPFMTMVVEIAPPDAGDEAMEALTGHNLSTIGLEGPGTIPVLAVPWQVAQKLHAVTEPPLRDGAPNRRYWDLVDLQLLQSLTVGRLSQVKDACVLTFAARKQHSWPPRITVYPEWAELYEAMATDLGMPITDVSDAVEVVHGFIDQIDSADGSHYRTE